MFSRVFHPYARYCRPPFAVSRCASAALLMHGHCCQFVCVLCCCGCVLVYMGHVQPCVPCSLHLLRTRYLLCRALPAVMCRVHVALLAHGNSCQFVSVFCRCGCVFVHLGHVQPCVPFWTAASARCCSLCRALPTVSCRVHVALLVHGHRCQFVSVFCCCGCVFVYLGHVQPCVPFLTASSARCYSL